MEDRDTLKIRKDKIKNIAIIFLTIMLVLTFFSNSILNYSLPEVATQTVQSGSITEKVRGTGTVTANDPYNVVVKESRVIESVNVKKGDEVEKDQVLFYLEDKDSDELEKAEAELEALNFAFAQKILSGDISATAFANAQGGADFTISQYQARIQAVNDKVTAAQNSVNTLTNDVNSFTLNMSVDDNNYTAYTDAKKAYEAANEKYKNSVSENDTEGMASAEEEKDDAKEKMDYYEDIINDSVEDNGDNQLLELKARLETAKAALETAKTEQAAVVKDVQTELEIGNQNTLIAEKQKEVKKLKEDSVGATIKSPVAGTVTEITKTAGETTVPEEALATIQVAGKGFTVSFSVTNEQAKKVKTGDVAELQNAWYYEDVKATLSKIQADTQNPGQNKLLVFNVEGSIQDGESLSLSVGQRSTDYDMIVPNSAIREDKNGKFILIIEEKTTPFGNRYKAKKVEVEVLASDDKQTAINATLEGYEYVITTSNKPVEPGKQVRLSDN